MSKRKHPHSADTIAPVTPKDGPPPKEAPPEEDQWHEVDIPPGPATRFVSVSGLGEDLQLEGELWLPEYEWSKCNIRDRSVNGGASTCVYEFETPEDASVWVSGLEGSLFQDEHTIKYLGITQISDTPEISSVHTDERLTFSCGDLAVSIRDPFSSKRRPRLSFERMPTDVKRPAVARAMLSTLEQAVVVFERLSGPAGDSLRADMVREQQDLKRRMIAFIDNGKK